MKVTGTRNWIHLIYPQVVFFVRRFHRQFIIKGFEKIPKDQAVIIAPNHQNAFMDAIIMIEPSGWKYPLSYLVRASIFQSKVANYLLRRMSMLPVYRKDVDGVENMEKNDEIFDNCIWLLSNKKRLVIFPEGTHNTRRKLIPLKKGITRIAFTAEEKNNFSLNLKIFPVGITYENPKEFNRNMLLQVGEPIVLADYYDVFRQNPARAHTLIKTELEKRIKDLMIHIPSDAFYEMTEGLRIIDASEKNIRNIEDDFKNSKQLIGKTENFIRENREAATVLKDMTAEYFSRINKAGFRDHLFSEKYKPGIHPLHYFLLFLLFPVYLYGFLHHFIPFYLPDRIARKKIKDPGFVSSIKCSLALVMFPVFRVSFCFVFYFFTGEFWHTFFYWISMVITGEIALWYQKRLKKLLVLRKFKKFRSTEAYNEAVFYRKKIVEQLEAL